MPEITVRVEDEIFEFENYDQWVNKGQSWFAPYKALSDHRYLMSVDAKGRICVWGWEFIRAKAEEAFPVKVYLITDRPEIKQCLADVGVFTP